MNFFEKVLNALEGTMNTPGNYGWFHIMFLIIVVVATVLLCKFFKDCSDTTFRKIILIGWIVIAVLEIYKQLIFSFEYSNGVSNWSYSWYAFPFQLCSTPLYALPFIAFLKDGKVRNAVISYTATFALFGGVAVMLYPNDVFIETIGINIQTMIHHGLQVVFGVFISVRYLKELGWKFVLRGLPVFVVFLIIAYGLNIGVYHYFQSIGKDDSFNMFYISPYFDCTLPVLSSIYPKVPYIAFALIYILGFTVIAFIMTYIHVGINQLVSLIKRLTTGKVRNA